MDAHNYTTYRYFFLPKFFLDREAPPERMGYDDGKHRTPDTMRPESSSVELTEFLTRHASLVAWLHAQSGASRWGVLREEFAAALHRSAGRHFGESVPSEEALDVFLCGLHLTDLAMACALRQGSEQAWEEFIARYRPVLYAAARAIVTTAGEARARELADSLYADLYGLKRANGEPRRSLLDYFHGRSKLGTWLRAVLTQRHVDTLRAAQRTESVDDQEGAGMRSAQHATATIAKPPDVDRERLLPRFRQAVSNALAALAPPDRLLVASLLRRGAHARADCALA